MSDLLKSIAKTLVTAVVSYAATLGFDITPEMQSALIVLLLPVLAGVANAVAERFPAFAKFWPAPMYLPSSPRPKVDFTPDDGML
jgi:hypothetical protein